MLTLDEAIKHCEEKAKELRKQVDTHMVVDAEEIGDCIECANEHEQLAGWLTELQERREIDIWNVIHTGADLPKESDYYLVTSEVRQGRKYVCLAFYNASKGKFLINASISVLGVIAWKPLPEPYKEGGAE